jgi:tetratricopeptide (TPR) repeat protein
MGRKDKKTPEQAPPQALFPLKETLVAIAVIFAAGFLAYSNSFKGQFIFDDDWIVADLQSHSFWQFVALPANRARLLVSLSLAANHALGGELWAYHAFNLAVHLLAALVLFGIIRRTLRLEQLRERFSGAASWLALAAAVLWLVHPLQTESVTYIWQRCEALGGLFYLLTLYCSIRASVSGDTIPIAAQSGHIPGNAGAKWRILAMLSCTLGMASKATVVTAPLAVFAYDSVFLAKDPAVAWRKGWKFYTGLAGTWLLLAVLISLSPSNTQANFKVEEWPVTIYLKTEPGVILHYLWLTFWPAILCLDYAWEPASKLSEILPGTMVLGILISATLWAWFRRSAWSYAGLWFFIILAPTTFLPVLKDLAFEHRMYLPLAALAVTLVVAAYVAGRELFYKFVPAANRRALGLLTGSVALLGVAVPLGCRTYKRNADYQNRLGMWEGVLQQRPNNNRAWNNAGFELLFSENVDKALYYFDMAISLNPEYVDAYNNRSVAYYNKKDYAKAEADSTKALQLDPTYVKAYLNRGNGRKERGAYDKALADYTRALALNPRYAEAYHNRGMTRHCMKDYDGAIADFNQALALIPRDADTWLSRANALKDKGEIESALSDLRQASAILPTSAKPLNNLGVVCRDKRDFDGAISYFSQALDLDPNNADILTNRGLARRDKGDYKGAIADYARALALEPRNAKCLYNRGVAFLQDNLYDEAIADFNRTLELNPGLATAYANRGVARERKGDDEGAAADYSQAIALDCKNWQAWLNKGSLLLKQGKQSEAKACYDEGFKINPGFINTSVGQMLLKKLQPMPSGSK